MYGLDLLAGACAEPSVGAPYSGGPETGATKGRSVRIEPVSPGMAGADPRPLLRDFVKMQVPSVEQEGAVPPWLEGHGRLAVARARTCLLHPGQLSDLERDPLSFVHHVLHRMQVSAVAALDWVRERPADRIQYLALYESERQAVSVLAATGLLRKPDAELAARLEQGFRDEVLVVLGKIVSRYRAQREKP